MIKYEVMSNTKLELLVKSINTSIANGWEPCGGITTAHRPDHKDLFIQAIIKHADISFGDTWAINNADGIIENAALVERKACAELISSIGFSHTAGLNQFVASEFARASEKIMERGS